MPFGSLFGGSKSSDTMEMEPWDDARPYLREGMRAGADLFRRGGFRPGVYGGDRVAGFTPAQRQGMQALQGAVPMGMQRQAAAAQGRLGRQAAQGFGALMDPNQRYRDFDAIKDEVADDVKSQLGGVFAGGGLESGAAQDAFARGLGGALGRLEFDAYNQGQNRSLQALGMAPAISAMQGVPADRIAAARAQEARNLLGAGALQQGQNQAELGADMAEFYERDGRDLAEVQGFANFIRPFGGLGGTQTGPAGPGTAQRLAGAGLTGIGAYGALGAAGMANPYAGGIAAGLGLLSAL